MTEDAKNPYQSPAANLAPDPLSPDILPSDPLPSEESLAQKWLANVYQGDNARQLSVRSIVSGMIIGGVMSVSNLYVGLKTGWGLFVTITSCIIAYALFNALEKIIPAYRRNPFTILENYTMSSAASAAGYMASAGLVSSFPALYLTTQRSLQWWEMMPWLAAVSLLGVFMAIPLKRQLINIDQLPFPEGIATAETLKSMHSHGVEAMQKAKALLWSGCIGAALVLWRDVLPMVGDWLEGKLKRPGLGESVKRFAFPEELPLLPGTQSLLEKLTLGFEGSFLMIAAGAIMGIRVGVSLLIGAVFYYGVLAPVLIELGIVKAGYRDIVSWTVWPATAMMVTSGLLAFALRWRTVVRAFSGLTTMFGKDRGGNDPLAHIEVPSSWFIIGTLTAGAACIYLGHVFFGITWWMGLLAVAVTFLLSIVAARTTGETSITPIGAMGKITQLIYGVLAPTNITTNLMTATITAGAASHSADLLTDLKCGYLLGGNPRKQTISQLFGVLAGTLACVPVYTVIVDPEKLGSKELPAPAAMVWAKVAKLLADGIEALPDGALAAMCVGAALGVVITLAEEFTPAQYRKWIPSATALGIAGVIPAFNSISMFLGALAAWLVARVRPVWGEKYTVPVASGLIAGESLTAVALRLWLLGPAMVAKIWQAVMASLPE